jgi:hypothetical protein
MLAALANQPWYSDIRDIRGTFQVIAKTLLDSMSKKFSSFDKSKDHLMLSI